MDGYGGLGKSELEKTLKPVGELVGVWCQPAPVLQDRALRLVVAIAVRRSTSEPTHRAVKADE